MNDSLALDAVDLMRSIREQMARELGGLDWRERQRRLAAELAGDPGYARLFGAKAGADVDAAPGEPDDPAETTAAERG